MRPDRRKAWGMALGLGGVAVAATAIAVVMSTPGPVDEPRPAAPQASHTASAETFATPAITPRLGPALARHISADDRDYTFEERRYVPEYTLPHLAARPTAGFFASPEAVVAELNAAMRRGDSDGVLALINDDSAEWKASITKRRQQFLDGWKQHGTPDYHLFLRRDVDRFVFVYSRKEGETQEDLESLIPLALEQKDGRWWLTQASGNHPVAYLEAHERSMQHAQTP